MGAPTVLPELLAAAAGRVPDRPALVTEDRSVTYRELDELASRVAWALSAGGVMPGDRVAVFAPKSVGTVAAVYGIMRAGAAYVPIDPASPGLRAGLIARDCEVAAVVADEVRWSVLAGELDRAAVRVLLDPSKVDAIAPAAGRPVGDRSDRELAYILYTSGSTGQPKGVMLSHRNALTFVRWAVGSLGVRSDDRFSSHAPLHFDLSVFDLYASALAGGTLFPVPDAAAPFGASMAEFVAAHGITVWYSVPSALVAWVTQGGVEPAMLASLRHVVFAGEVFPTPYLRRLAALVPGAALHNWYGPTETNVCTYFDVADVPSTDEPLPIGRACDGYACIVREGELLVGGDGVMLGYWGQAERTAEALVPDPRDPTRPGPYYRTGDLVEELADGNLWFLGRRDHQVKTRGYRVELGEVEAAIYANDDVREACVVAVPDDRIGHALVAFVAPAPGAAPTSPDIKRGVAARLPRYMVPAEVRFLEPELPKTSTGKIDRQALEKRATDG